jgi:hypothetical protein
MQMRDVHGDPFRLWNFRLLRSILFLSLWIGSLTGFTRVYSPLDRAKYQVFRSLLLNPAAQKTGTEGPVRQGALESPWSGLVAGVVQGEKDFAQRLLRGRAVNLEEQTAARQLEGRVEWAEVVRQMEGLRYQTAAQAVKRFGAALAKDAERQRFIAALKRRLSTI